MWSLFLKFGKDILYILEIYIAQINISVYTLFWVSEWKFPPLPQNRDLPRVFGVAYLLYTLVYLDKTADIHDPRAHQSLLCPSVSALAPNIAKGGKRGRRTRGG